MTNCEIVNLLIRDKITEFKGELNEENMYALGVTLTYNYSWYKGVNIEGFGWLLNYSISNSLLYHSLSILWYVLGLYQK